MKLNIEFTFDKADRPNGWRHKSGNIRVAHDAEQPKNTGVAEQELKYYPLKKKDFHSSARALVEATSFYGGHVDWGEFTPDQQEKLIWRFEQCRIEVDQVYEEYKLQVTKIENKFIQYMLRMKLGEEET